VLHVRSIWNGAISFGLVSIPIKLVNATESHSISFRQIHLEDGGRIRYRKVCELEEREVATDEIGKGYEEADGEIIPITDDDLAQLPIPTAKTIEIEAFVPADRIDPLQMGSAYYLAANGVPAAKPYALLREALRRSQKVAICKYALRGRERLGMLRVVDDVIAMHGLLWPDEIRSTDEVAPDMDVTVREKELDLADALMNTLGEVDLTDLHDDYREAVEELITAKASGEAPPTVPAAPAGGKVLDLMSALENSVRAAKEARGEGAGGREARGGEAEVTPLPEEGATGEPSRAEAKEAAGKKSAAGAKKAAKKTTAGAGKPTAGAKKKADESAAADKKTTAKKTTAKKTTTRKRASA
jgi:DNA end-binding protein Ku